MNDDGGNDYDEDVPGGTEFGHDHGNFSSAKNTGKGCAMKKLKTFEVLLSAVYTLIAAGLTIIKFINQINKLKTAKA